MFPALLSKKESCQKYFLPFLQCFYFKKYFFTGAIFGIFNLFWKLIYTNFIEKNKTKKFIFEHEKNQKQKVRFYNGF